MPVITLQFAEQVPVWMNKKGKKEKHKNCILINSILHVSVSWKQKQHIVQRRIQDFLLAELRPPILHLSRDTSSVGPGVIEVKRALVPPLSTWPLKFFGAESGEKVLA